MTATVFLDTIEPLPFKWVILFFLNKNSTPLVSVNTDFFFVVHHFR